LKPLDKISRRRFLKASAGSIAASAGGVLLPLITGCQESSSSKTESADGLPIPDNVLLITADDVGWKDMGCYGNAEIATPNIDRLANEGVRFDNAFVTSSSCSPSRATLITGQYPHTNGVDGLPTSHPEKSLPKGYRTLPSMLRDSCFDASFDACYNTAIEGKWHVAPFDHPSHYGYNQRLSNILEQEIKNSERTRAFIQANADKRFYLEVNYMNTHRNMKGEFEFDPDFPVDPEQIAVPEYWHLPDWPEIRIEVAKFYSQAMRMDFMIGEVLDKLDELGIAEDTMVIFLSDNGPPFPGCKMTCYDRGTATPLLIRWPRVIQPGSSVSHQISVVDIMPTILEAAGILLPDDLQGSSFLPLLTDPGSGPIRDAVFTEMTWHVFYLPTRAIRCNGWKYIRNLSEDPVGLDQCEDMEWAQRLAELPDQPWTRPRIPEELYHLESDPNEQNNLIDNPDHWEVLADMRSRLDQHMRETKDPFAWPPA